MGGLRRYGPGELVEVPGLGAASFEPRTTTQKHDLIFDKKNPPRDEERRPVFRVKAESRKPVCGSRRRKGRDVCCDPGGSPGRTSSAFSEPRGGCS
jgi:hypothetical protein